MKRTLLSINRIINHKQATQHQKERAVNYKEMIETGDERDLNTAREGVKKIVLDLIKVEFEEKSMRIK